MFDVNREKRKAMQAQRLKFISLGINTNASNPARLNKTVPRQAVVAFSPLFSALASLTALPPRSHAEFPQF
jgi:hypothetical protein